MQTHFVKASLSLIVLLLLVIVCRPVFEPKATHAAGSKVQYKVVDISGGIGPDALKAVENQLNELGNDGWTLVACPNGFGPCVFKR